MLDRLSAKNGGQNGLFRSLNHVASIAALSAGIASFAFIGSPLPRVHAQVACGASTPGAAGSPSTPVMTSQAAPTVAPAETEQSPPGDIPDNQQFVPYTSSAGGYVISMPEGWARQENGAAVVFSDKLHRFSVDVSCVTTAPTIESATAQDTASLSQSVPAFALVDVTAVDLPAGPAILVRYQANSAPDDVTGKVYRLDIDRYEIFKDGRLAVIELAVPAGSDNVDVSNQVSQSFQWTA